MDPDEKRIAETAGQTPSSPGTLGEISPANSDICGARLPGVSEWAFSFGAQASQPSSLQGLSGAFTFGYDGHCRSDFSSNASPSAVTRIAGYCLSNFRLGFRGDDELKRYAWARNAVGENCIEQQFIAPGNTGLIAGLPGDPRTFGATISQSF